MSVLTMCGKEYGRPLRKIEPNGSLWGLPVGQEKTKCQCAKWVSTRLIMKVTNSLMLSLQFPLDSPCHSRSTNLFEGGKERLIRG